MKKKWLVQVKVEQIHGYIVEAETVEEAKKVADSIEWGEDTCEDWLAVKSYGEPTPVGWDE
jgi:hypothetical protein